jgi:hypothetical protein
VLISLKVVYFSYFLAKGLALYHSLGKRREQCVLGLFLGLMVMIPIYDLGVPEKIWVLYLMLGTSYLGTIKTFQMIKGDERGLTDNLMLGVGILLMILGVIPRVGAFCKDDQIYRNSS